MWRRGSERVWPGLGVSSESGSESVSGLRCVM